MYWPTRSSRVTAIRWPLRTNPRRCSISAMRMATVVLPVPGLPVKDMCRLGAPEAMPRAVRAFSTARNAAISRSRVLTGTSPTSSASSCSSASVTLAFGLVGRIGADGVADRAALALLAHQLEAGFHLGPIDDVGHARCFPAARGIEGGDAHVVLGEGLAALVDLFEDAGRILEIEHGIAVHIPIGIARMRIIGVLDADGPALLEGIVELRGDLHIRQIRQE